MKITFIGHAGLFIETRHGSILCDPWFNPAYFASWFPFPSNEDVDPTKIGRPTYLYLSHLHRDHFDADFLRKHVWKEAIVLLPDYPLDLMEQALRDLGFTRFIKTTSGEALEIDGLRFMITSLVAPTDGPLGDSGLAIDDGEVRIFDQNDSRPMDLDVVNSFGPYDAHFLQFSGAIWYPMVYKMPEKAKQALGRKKRANQMARALRYVRQTDASFVFPSAGPPCFLDDDLFHFNDFDRDPANIFPDQTVFLEYMQEHGMDNGRLLIPGSVATLSKDDCTVAQPIPDDQVQAIFTEKQAYLEAYKARKQPLIDAIKASWSRGQVDILSSLRDWFEPLLEQADLNCVGINGRVLLDCEVQEVVIDFQKRQVYEWSGEEYDYRFRIAPELVEHQILNHEEDWVNSFFLSCRFEAKRKGAYNEYVYNFFKVLSPERLQYSESYYAQSAPVRQLWECAGFMVQRNCPHLKADLTRFGEEKEGVLTCMVHGWQFDLTTGRCLTSDDVRLYTKPILERETSEKAP
ncbi:MAG: MBL fold metallo-hydrolase [Actinomycetota bacterium]|nr:MBL fold metallo-hydrolase [Actinomycetota bacterium]